MDGQRDAILEAIQNEIIKISVPSINHDFSRKLGSGELGVLNLAIEKNAEQIIIDDKKARNEAKEFGLALAFTTDILKLAERRQLITSYAHILEQLRAIRIYLPVYLPE